MKTRTALLTADFFLVSASFWLASLCFHLAPHKIWIFYLLFLGTKILVFYYMGLYRVILRFAGLPLASTIIKAMALSSVLCFFFVEFRSSQEVSGGFVMMDYLLTTFLVGLLRFAPRYFSESWKGNGTKRILIYGAGDLGEEVARKLLRNPEDYRLIGFIDDKSSKIGKQLHNLPIYGPIDNLSQIFTEHKISELIIAISALEGDEVRSVTRQCRIEGVFCGIVPTFSDMLKKEVDIKNIDISDLLRREPKDLDEPRIQGFVKDKVIMITGAGGSIGSELSRQCIRYGAHRLILIDHSEFNLYRLKEELVSSKTPILFRLLNVLNKEDLEQVIKNELPSIVFHAAAYKHVPIVEENPFEGVINNVQGTVLMAQIAEKYGVEKFILISTDKAVRPASIMGATKRIAELYIQNLNPRSKTEFVTVRFGNVLGSSGSVIPKFIEQINKGGPVTVTHPEVTRYFMLINEAVQLVLQAASIGDGGEIFILNMGKPVKISEMAEDLIFLSGREPYKDIPIEFTGLRPGEKLYEELLINASEKKTQYENITVGGATYMDWGQLHLQIDQLLRYAKEQNREGLLRMIKALVPEFINANVTTTTSPKMLSNFAQLHKDPGILL